ncbi:hypothetical protein PHMEG_00021255 [Phytophthora megakarya]|uniref:Uncharacterized protein n=1 Tax=Phytophthora megakarya TaxID=4795 RepID=A0A225VMZ2_9STRA|nr:hypothetical protein PHMEG_00021255 [Phytophthora megakarya]
MTYEPVGEQATIVLSGIGTDLSEGMLMNMYRTYGPIVRVRHNGTNSAQVIFAQKQHALKAVEATNGAVVYGKKLKVLLQRNFKKSTEPCRGFAAGICRKGDMCKYYHATDDAVFASAPPVVAKAVAKVPREPKKKTPKPKPAPGVKSEAASIPGKQLCRHFTRGYCEKGAECTFAHVLGVPKDAAPAPTGKVAHGSEQESESKTETQSEDTRTCIECEKPGVAVWKCAKCDNSLYCDDCNSAVHRARVMAKHKRTKLPPVLKLPRCGECESKTANVRCEQCDVPFCASCDASVHKFKSLRKHTRVKLSSKTEKVKPKATKPQEDPKPAKKEEKKKTPVVEAPQVKVVDPVAYVESVPQLDFSSESESSESEDEEMPEAKSLPAQTSSTPVDDDDEPMPTAANVSDTESEEDFDDVKPQSSAPATSTPVKQTPESSESESEDDFDDKPSVKSTPPPASVPKMELSSDSDSSDDEAPEPATKVAVSLKSKDESEGEASRKPAAVKPTPTPARKPTLAELSSESESDDDNEAPSKPAVKQTTKPAPKPAPASVSSESSSDESEDEAPSKPTAKTKANPSSKPVAKKATSSSSESSSSESSDSSEDEAPPAKPVKATPARRAPAPVPNQKAGGISEGSSHTLVKKIEAFNESSEGDELHLDANLNGFERLLAHDCAERLGLGHESIGSGLERHIIISRSGAKRAAADSNGRKSKKSKHHH